MPEMCPKQKLRSSNHVCVIDLHILEHAHLNYQKWNFWRKTFIWFLSNAIGFVPNSRRDRDGHTRLSKHPHSVVDCVAGTNMNLCACSSLKYVRFMSPKQTPCIDLQKTAHVVLKRDTNALCFVFIVNVWKRISTTHNQQHFKNQELVL